MSNPVTDLIRTFQELSTQVPELLQPVIVATAATVPFIEGELAAGIGVVAGLHPVVAALAGVVGNLASVTLLVLLGSRVRTAIDDRSSGPDKPRSARMRKFQRAFDRFGVPGVSLLGPALMPTHFTATALATSGVPKSRVLAWQAVAIALWTAAITALATGALGAL